MVCCAVMGCSSNNNKKCKDSSNSKFRYFTFPSSEEICKLWVKNCCQKYKFNLLTARICSSHFSKDDYQMKEKLLKLPFVKWKLKPDAIPSLNIPFQMKEQPINLKICDESMEKIVIMKNICDNIQQHDTPELLPKSEIILMERDNVGVGTITEPQSDTTSKSIATQTTSSPEQSVLLEQIRFLEDENRSLVLQLLKERDERMSVEHQNRSLVLRLEKEKNGRRSVEKIFNNGQLRKLKTEKQIHWNRKMIKS